mmetsp:Transcript_79925/g.212118  ORF Transcript_79925/g.212118 Transcript_79925/m.212118 type:complete len:405 (-) Transcript_79925:130-1344(-)
MLRCALKPLLVGVAFGLSLDERARDPRPGEELLDGSSLALVQEEVRLHGRRPKEGAYEGLRGWGYSFASSAAVNLAPVNHSGSGLRNPFKKAIVVSISPEKYEAARERLEAQGVSAEPFWGYNGKEQKDIDEALSLLRKYNNSEHLHETVGNFLACLHMSPGTPPRIGSAFHELISRVLHRGPGNVQEMLAKDHHHCVPKMVAIAASHVRLWEGLANGSLPTASEPDGEGEDPWFLIMEDDAALCPGWRQRMELEVPQIPSDADIVKLFFFGHWRKEDQLPNGPDGQPSPFLMGRDPMRGSDIAKASLYEIMKGASVDTVPIAGFYAGTQAYLVKRRSARKLLSQIKGKPFQDIDMTMLTSVKHYVWRRVLSMNAPDDSDKRHHSLMQVVPVCNREPPKDWFFR